EELALLDEVSLAGLVDQLGDLRHRPVNRQLAHAEVGPEAEEEAGRAHHEATQEELVPGEAEEAALLEARELEVDLTAGTVLGTRRLRRGGRGLTQQRRHREQRRQQGRARRAS